MRASGILLPVSSLPSRYGIGCFSREAYEFVDQLEKAGQSGAQNGFLEFMIHEQYFYPDYCRYIPEFGDMVFSACRFARDRGYMGQSLSTLFAGLF